MHTPWRPRLLPGTGALRRRLKAKSPSSPVTDTGLRHQEWESPNRSLRPPMMQARAAGPRECYDRRVSVERRGLFAGANPAIVALGFTLPKQAVRRTYAALQRGLQVRGVGPGGSIVRPGGAHAEATCRLTIWRGFSCGRGLRPGLHRVGVDKGGCLRKIFGRSFLRPESTDVSVNKCPSPRWGENREAGANPAR